MRIPYLLPVAAGVVLVTLTAVLHRRDLDEARERWALREDGETARVAGEVTDVFRSMYEGLRTIARLPGVRTIDRYAANFDANARQTVQEIYNNLATHVAMSEVYLVPLDLDPDAIDPHTGRLQEPILTFDQLIVGRTAELADGAAGHDPDEVEEVEIHEYRLMRRQLRRFAELCPTEESVHGLDYPALTGPEVVTCDNRFYSPHRPDDEDRSGLVYSVPLFGPDGNLRGCVSGVILSRALRTLLPAGHHALRHRGHDLLLGSMEDGAWSEYRDDVAAGMPGRDLRYSRVLDLRIADGGGQWQLWTGRANLEFEASVEAMQANVTGAVLAITSIALALGLGLRERRGRQRRNAEREQRRDLEAACRAAENLSRARSNLVAVTSHEIRTPITGLLQVADKLLQTELRPDQRSLLEGARKSTRTLVDLLDGILEYSEIETGQLRLEAVEFDLHALFENLLDLMAPVVGQKPIEFTLLLGDGLPQRAVGDPSRLRQVAASLVGNAVKFTNQGSVSIRADWMLTADRPLLCLRVSDTGIGLDRELRDRLFEPFTQGEDALAQFGGLGLGLAICRGLCAAMGGSIDHLPTPTGGTTFVVTLPLELPTIRSMPVRPLQRRRVLLVTPRLRFAVMLRHDLMELGAEVTAVHTGSDAQVALAAAATPFAAMVVDGGLPPEELRALFDGMDDADSDDEPPVLLLDGWGQSQRDRAQLPACVTEIGLLPIPRSALGQTLERAIRSSQLDGRPAALLEVDAPAPEVDPTVHADEATMRAPVLAAAPEAGSEADADAPTEPGPAQRTSAAPMPAVVARRSPDLAAAAPLLEPSPRLRTPEPATATTATHTTASPAVDRPRILVVDDTDAALLITCAQLRRLGYEAVAARSGIEALAESAGRAFDLVLVDRTLRDLDGPATVLRLRASAAQRAVPAPAFVGVVEPADGEADRAACLTAGMTAVLARPFTGAALEEAVRQALGSRAR